MEYFGRDINSLHLNARSVINYFHRKEILLSTFERTMEKTTVAPNAINHLPQNENFI